MVTMGIYQNVKLFEIPGKNFQCFEYVKGHNGVQIYSVLYIDRKRFLLLNIYVIFCKIELEASKYKVSM